MSLSLTELKEKTPTQLADFARELNLQNVTRMRRQDQIFSILKTQSKRGEKIKGEGVVEILQDGYGFLRSASSSYNNRCMHCRRVYGFHFAFHNIMLVHSAQIDAQQTFLRGWSFFYY